jgi:hypothetical protein
VADPTRGNGPACFHQDSRNWINASKGAPGGGTPDGTGWNGTNLARDLSGDIRWTPSDLDVNTIIFGHDPPMRKGGREAIARLAREAARA